MANFEKALLITLKSEGVYDNDPQDTGGETYKGIARNKNPQWSGWVDVDVAKRTDNFPANLESNVQLQESVKSFYKTNYWDKVQGDKIDNQCVAESIFDFAVNAGHVVSSKLAQSVVSVPQDGIIGQITVVKINAIDAEIFLKIFALNKIARYIDICDKRAESKKYFFGWVKRALRHARETQETLA